MSIALYRQYRQALKRIPESGRTMPYNWGNLPHPGSVIWLMYSFMFEEFSRELANAINAFTHNVRSLAAWAEITRSFSDERKMRVAFEFIDTLATNAVNMPYVLRSRFIFAAAHLCHQANRFNDAAWKENLPLNEEIYFCHLDDHGRSWRKYSALKCRIEALCSRSYQKATHDFRNAYNHRFSSRFMFGFTGVLERQTDKATGAVKYLMKDIPPFELDTVVELLTMERDHAYRAFDAFQSLVREHEESIARNQERWTLRN